MSNDNRLPVLPFLVPFMAGIPSRRHFVVLRRAITHLEQLSEFISSVISNLPTPEIPLCHMDFMENKVRLMEMAVEELEERTPAEARAQVADLLEVVKQQLLAIKAAMRMQ